MLKDQHLPVPASPPGALQSRELEYYEYALPEKGRFREYFHILFKRRWWLLGTLLGIVTVTGAVCLLMTPIYKAATTLQITQDNPGSQLTETDPMAVLKGGQDLTKFQETQNKILTSRALAGRIIQNLGLEDHPEFRALKAKDPHILPQKLQHDLVDLFLSKLAVNPVKDSFLVEVSFKSADMELAQRVTNGIAKEYMQLAIDSRSQSFTLVKDWLEKQLQQMADKLQGSSKKLVEYGQKNDFFALEGKDNVIVNKYIELAGLLTKAQSERMAREAQYQQIKERGPDAPLITNNPLIGSLRQEFVAQNAKVASQARIYLPGHPEMQAEQARLGELKSRLGTEVKRLEDSVKADFEAATRAERLLQEALDSQKGQLANLQSNLIDFQILKRDAQSTEKLYQALLNRMGEATVASTMVASNVAVIDPATLPAEPHLPKTGLFLALSGIIGLFLGIGAAFVVEYLDDSLKTTEEVERICQLPSLGVVPQLEAPRNGLRAGSSWIWRHLPFFKGEDLDLGVNEPQGADLVVLNQPRSMVSEAIRHLRTSLMLSASGGPPAAILVTSPNPQEGKSTIACNLAAALALDGRRVVLLDCDLRKPRLHRVFNQASQPGLTNFLTGGISLDEILQPTQVPNLWFIPAGAVPPSPAELLNSQAYRKLLQDLRQDFQHLVIDTAPALGFADARVVSALADGVVLVVRHHSTPREAGRLTRQLFSQVHAHLLGIILNQVESNGFGRYDYYYYHKCYDSYYRDPENQELLSEGRPGKLS